MFSKALIAAVALAGSVLAAAEPPQLIFPPSSPQCVPTLIQWEGGQGPYTFGITRGQNRVPVEEFPNIPAGTSEFTWQVNLKEGTAFAYTLVDSTGASTASPLFSIQPGNDNCVLLP